MNNKTKNFFAVVFLFFCLCMKANSSSAKSQQESEARAVIASVKNEIISKIDYSSDELKKMNSEFVDYYFASAKPRLNNLEQYINPQAMHFIDIDEDGQKELLFYSEGLSPSAFGPKNFIAIVAKKNNKWILAKLEIVEEVTIFCKKIGECFFAASHLKIKPKTPNKYISAALFYVYYGASDSTFFTTIVGYNSYEKEFYFKTINSPIPVIDDDRWQFSKLF